MKNAFLPAVLLLSGCSSPSPSATKDETARTAPPPVVTASSITAAPPPPPPPLPDTPPAAIVKLAKIDEAIAFAKPYFGDSVNKPDPGAVLFVFWGIAHMKLADVAAATDETSFARVLKDADAERGKRLCVRGTIVQIKASKVDAGKFFEGLLVSPSQDLYNYVALGGSGDLVEHSPARLCGVVIGTYDYSNSGGGTGHAITVVGMFDLPENRKP